MIGNDIVDFRKAALESNWQRKGYLDKLFCREEKNLIFDSTDPDQMVWLLWSMKEAGYKIHFRHKPIRIYQPQNIICSHLLMKGDTASGLIHYDGQSYFSRSMLNADFVHTYAVGHYSIFNDLCIMIENNKVENNLTGNYQNFTSSDYLLDYTIIKNYHSVPDFLNERTGEKLPLSISHHGRFSSLIFLSNK